MDVVADKEKNLLTVEEHFKTSLGQAKIVLLPEMFNCPYDTSLFEAYAEVEGGKTYKFLSELARTYGVAIVAGSIPEREGNNIYNTSYIFDESGQCLAKHRKTHLFDVDIKGGITFKESDTLSAGNQSTVIDLGWIKIGVCICYDMRFPEFIRSMVLEGAQLILVPAAFNTITGPAHWSVTGRARAIDNQCYMALASPARSKSLSYQAYGHSMVVDPWGEIIQEAGSEVSALSVEINLKKVEEVRQALPLLKHMKKQVY